MMKPETAEDQEQTVKPGLEEPKAKDKKSKKTKIKEVGYKRFVAGAVLEMWIFRLVTGLIIIIPGCILGDIAEWISSSEDSVLTTANLGYIMNWRLPLILVSGLLFVLICVWIELFSQISMCSKILKGEKAGVFAALGSGFKALISFISPAGILLMIFVILPVPLSGLGFALSATRDFYIPEFIQSVIRKNPVYYGLELTLGAMILFFYFRLLFAFHAAVIDHKKAKEAIRDSWRLTGEHFWNYTLRLLRVVLIAAAVTTVSFFILDFFKAGLSEISDEYRTDQVIDLFEEDEELDDDELEIMGFRVVGASVVFVGGYLVYIISALCSSTIMIFFTKAYYEYTGRKFDTFYKQGGAGRILRNTVFVLGSLTAFAIISILAGLFFDQVFERREPVRLIAHRTGGMLASENSLEGIDEAAKCGCYGSETDIQRTKDGYYVINHDKSFKRLTGVNKKPGEMTLDEIKELSIHDTTGNGKLLPVPTLEELLDRGSEDGIVLFLELKGESVDRKMADDIVRAVREKDMTDQVVLISLNYDTIQYAERTYPEFRTGILIFGTLGDVSKLDCDILIMEEEISTTNRIDNIHEAGKEVMVWTVNTEYELQKYLDMEVDGIITDEIELAVEVENELQKRNDMELMEDRTEDLFEGWY